MARPAMSGPWGARGTSTTYERRYFSPQSESVWSCDQERCFSSTGSVMLSSFSGLLGRRHLVGDTVGDVHGAPQGHQETRADLLVGVAILPLAAPLFAAET